MAAGFPDLFRWMWSWLSGIGMDGTVPSMPMVGTYMPSHAMRGSSVTAVDLSGEG